MRGTGVIVAAATAVAGVALVCAPAAEAAAYRYWTYWQGSADSWAFATAGPASLIPPDGSVEGWRFTVATQSGDPTDEPRVAPDFADICGATAPVEGSKRIAVVIDPGPAAMAPTGEEPPRIVTSCAVVPTDATGFQALQEVASVRTDAGLVCGVAGYPSRECAPVLDDAEAEAITAAAASEAIGTPTDAAADPASTPADARANPAPTGSGSPVATIAVATLLLVAGAVAATSARRRRGGVGRD